MSKHQDRFIIARNVQSADLIQHCIATLSTRPLRIAFVIHEGLPNEAIERVLQYNSLVWGGNFNLLIPSNGKTIDDDWFKTLTMHDPDYIFLCGDIDDFVKHQIYQTIQPFFLYQWWDEFVEKLENGEDPLNNITLNH